MGEVRAKTLIANPLKPQLNPIELDCLVDTGAVMTMLPHDLIEELEVAITEKATVTPANDQAEEMAIAALLACNSKIRLPLWIHPV